MPLLEAFVYLQFLDLLTTLVGFKLGAQEASPLMRFLIQIGPLSGILLGKAAAAAIVGYCVWTRRHRVIGWVNYWFAALVVWNFFIILTALGAVRAAG